MAPDTNLPPIEIRPATEQDAEVACEVLRHSITALCVIDHNNDEVILAAWLQSKTPANLRTWIASDTGIFIVAAHSAEICGAACLKASGDIVLCYVSPATPRQGVGTAMLLAMEQQADAWGLTELFLTSTRTALPFYLKMGYVQDGPTADCFGIEAYPLRKAFWR